ncbi:hypothetical protein GY45DRAFT_1355158 [Cubamyces sp. BRFM 1775]|nr:hypothetical protein GY45DRAFT_1355158 [Cubamyces sp. BRFM 1775]
MTTRYNLRSRAESPPNEANTIPGEFSSPLSSTTDAALDVSAMTGAQSLPHASVPSASERRPGITYSQAVTSRSPSPTAGEAASAAIPFTSTGAPAVNNAGRKHRVTVEEVADDEDDGTWTEVRRRRRTQSTGSIPVDRYPISAHGGPALTAQQDAVVRTAEAKMSAAEREHVRHRMEVVSNGRRSNIPQDSRGEGPSRDKGKTVDARNWGAVGIPHEELDPDAQRRELELYSVHRNINDNIFDGYDTDEQRRMLEHWKSIKSQQPIPQAAESMKALGPEEPELHVPVAIVQELEALRQELQALRENSQARGVVEVRKGKGARAPSPPALDSPAEHLVASVMGERAPRATPGRPDGKRGSSLRPVAQLEPGSYLGQAFQGLAGGEPSSGGSSSSSSSSSSSGDERRHGGGSDGFSSSSSEPPASAQAGHGQKRRKGKKKHTKRPVLKPERPEPYDGQPDAQVFHKFMRQMTEYIAGYQLARDMHASTVSNFLTGNAYRFFVTTVSNNPHKWRLRELFIELFNYCFPVDYRLQMHDRLRKLREYVHELESLFLMVGFVSDREKVDKLWNGLSHYIQKELWKKELTPTHSAWSDVREAAELIEIAERVQNVATPTTTHPGQIESHSGTTASPSCEAPTGSMAQEQGRRNDR